jgi:hypothetical protein
MNGIIHVYIETSHWTKSVSKTLMTVLFYQNLHWKAHV